MNIREFNRVIKQGFIGIFRNRLMSLASIGSVASTLLILGIVLILILNVNNITNMTKEQFDEIHLYLNDDISQERIEAIGDEIREYEGVLSVVFQSKEQALEVMKEDWGSEGYLLEGLDENPLPNSYIIQLEDIQYADSVVDKLNGLTGIEEVKYYRDIVNKLLNIANVVKNGGLIIIGILMLISIFIISNTIKITVAARRKEIGIMKFVGATNGFIRGPFIIEGMLLGVLGSLISISIINYGYKSLFKIANDKAYVLFTVYLIPHYSLINDIVIIFTAIGVGIGILGSIISVKRFLKV